MHLTITRVLTAGLLLRLGMLAYGAYQDAYFPVKYTDIDYVVFTDAARAMLLPGGSPYDRATYRYTPILAALLTPNILLHPAWGKMCFVLADLGAGWLLWRLLYLRGAKAQKAAAWSALWTLNPFVANISTRGSAESILALLVLSTLYALFRRRTTLAAILLGLSVHVKIYPILYAIPAWFFLDDSYTGHVTPLLLPSSVLGSIRRFFSPTRMHFAIVAAATFLTLSGIMYHFYGWDFLHETYLYHVTRKDHRHNFSPWFYHLYLTSADPTQGGGDLSALLTFAPQFLSVLVVGIRYASDPAFACFTQTVLFVAFNKVCTSQYFMWFLSLLPLVLPFTTMRMKGKGAIILTLWILSQALWLYYGFYLEFRGENTFRALWAASLLLFLTHIWGMGQFMQSHRLEPVMAQGEIRKVHDL